MHPLSDASRDRYVNEWSNVQTMFVRPADGCGPIGRRARPHRVQFGPEYDRIVDAQDNRRSAEVDPQTARGGPNTDLSASTATDARGEACVAAGDQVRERPVQLLEADELQATLERWRAIQGEFVDEPRQAINDADVLVAELMQRLASSFAANATSSTPSFATAPGYGPRTCGKDSNGTARSSNDCSPLESSHHSGELKGPTPVTVDEALPQSRDAR